MEEDDSPVHARFLRLVSRVEEGMADVAAEVVVVVEEGEVAVDAIHVDKDKDIEGNR